MSMSSKASSGEPPNDNLHRCVHVRLDRLDDADTALSESLQLLYPVNFGLQALDLPFHKVCNNPANNLVNIIWSFEIPN